MIAACAIIPGWAVGEAVISVSDTSALGSDVVTGIWTAVIGLSFATLVAGWDYINPFDAPGLLYWLKKSGPWGAGFGFISGFIANAIYIHFIQKIFASLTFTDLLHIRSNADIYLTRAFGWGIFGAGMGVALAGGFGNDPKKVLNGLVGGAIGGALGGLFFNWATFHISSGGISRLLGLVIVGVAIVVAVGVVERVRRDAWLFVSGGPMAGKEFIVYGSHFSIGSSPDCDMTIVKDVGIAARHMAIQTEEQGGAQRRIVTASQQALVLVNGTPVARHELKAGDVVTLGGTSLQYDERGTSGFN
jgi:Inner membrane component of T3SS, cytoplasmic domain